MGVHINHLLGSVPSTLDPLSSIPNDVFPTDARSDTPIRPSLVFCFAPRAPASCNFSCTSQAFVSSSRSGGKPVEFGEARAPVALPTCGLLWPVALHLWDREVQTEPVMRKRCYSLPSHEACTKQTRRNVHPKPSRGSSSLLLDDNSVKPRSGQPQNMRGRATAPSPPDIDSWIPTRSQE